MSTRTPRAHQRALATVTYLVSLTTLVTCASVEKATSPKVAAVSVTLTPSPAKLITGQQLQFVATATDLATGVTLDVEPIVWTTSNAGVVTVDAAGLATASGPGSARIIGTRDGVSGVAAVTVTAAPVIPPPSSVAINQSTSQIAAGQQIQLSATVLDGNGNPMSTSVTWLSHNTGVATVDTAGVVTAINTGVATITATSHGQGGTALIAVNGASLLSLATVSAGDETNCGLTANGAAYCWGDNTAGSFGNGTDADGSSVPVPGASGLAFKSLSLGSETTCGLTADGAAYCWGVGSYGELGNGSMVDEADTPVAVSGGLTFTSVSVGGDYACAVAIGGAVYCWGAFYGATPTPITGGLTVQTVSLGMSNILDANSPNPHSCGVTASGAAYCWGGNAFGELGDSTTISSRTPVPVVGGLAFKAVSAGGGFTCGITTSGDTYCWGSNFYGTLAASGMASSSTPVLVAGGPTFASLSAGENDVCGLTAEGVAYCWGANHYGQVGLGAISDVVSAPTAVVGGLTFSSLAVGTGGACGTTASGATYCWGFNANGNLGNGSTRFVQRGAGSGSGGAPMITSSSAPCIAGAAWHAPQRHAGTEPSWTS